MTRIEWLLCAAMFLLWLHEIIAITRRRMEAAAIIEKYEKRQGWYSNKDNT